ncbi:hypothetical protein HZA55_05760 [Candidatus Poribacteria bacterium]|nr:hypothetical protein [Candidatus Poribacteria bacterium]
MKKLIMLFIVFIILTILNTKNKNLITNTYAKDMHEEYFQKAHEFINEKKYDRAITQLMKVLENSPNNIQARLLIADTKNNQMFYEDAYDQIFKILKIEPDNISAIKLGNKIFSEALINRDFNAYRNFLFYTCNYIFNQPRSEVERFLTYLLKEHKTHFINNQNQINPKGAITIHILSNTYSSFNISIAALTKYYTYKDIEGNYPARMAIENIKTEEQIRKNPLLLKEKKE